MNNQRIMTTYRSRRPQTTGGLFLTDGGLPTGRLLQEAIEQTDEVTGGHPACYMSNCAHPTRSRQSLSAGGDRLDRVRGLRANASTRSQVSYMKRLNWTTATRLIRATGAGSQDGDCPAF